MQQQQQDGSSTVSSTLATDCNNEAPAEIKIKKQGTRSSTVREDDWKNKIEGDSIQLWTSDETMIEALQYYGFHNAKSVQANWMKHTTEYIKLLENAYTTEKKMKNSYENYIQNFRRANLILLKKYRDDTAAASITDDPINNDNNINVGHHVES